MHRNVNVNLTPRVLSLSFTQEDTWEIWGKVPSVLDLCNRWREAVRFTHWLFQS